MKRIDELLNELRTKEAHDKYGPAPDIAICCECGGRFKEGEYDLEWEHEGYGPEGISYKVPVCRVCEDGGCIDEWDFSPEQFKKYKEWENVKKKES